MMKNLPFLKTWILTALIVCNGCATGSLVTRGEAYEGFYQEQAKSLVIMPPVNDCDVADAGEILWTSMGLAVNAHGYYTTPSEISRTIFQMAGISDGGELWNMREHPSARIKELFGADLALYSRVTEWDTFTSSNTVTMEVEVRSLVTGNLLMARRCTGTSAPPKDDNSLLGSIASIVRSAMSMANRTKIKRDLSDALSARCIEIMPSGPYSAKFLIDSTVFIGRTDPDDADAPGDWEDLHVEYELFLGRLSPKN